MFSAYFPRFLGVRKVRKILDVFEVLLGIFEKTKEKKDREVGFPQIPERAPKVCKAALSAQKVCRKCGFAHF